MNRGIIGKQGRAMWLRAKGALVLAGVAVVTVMVLGTPGKASAADAAPAWSILAQSLPTNFVPGQSGSGVRPPMYLVTAINVGGESTNGTYAVSVTLPPSFSLDVGGATAETQQQGSPGARHQPLTCSANGLVVTCEGSVPLAPDEFISMWVPVNVPAGTPPSEPVVEATASVSGGGIAVTGRSTTVDSNVTSGLPVFDFLSGPKGAWASASTAAGQSATQAGAHPYQLTVGMSFPNYVPLEVEPIGGGVKDVLAALPRGVVVNPNATTMRCTQEQLEASDCPAAAQVGVLNAGVVLATPQGNWVPVYNMVPPAGSPAELGFEIIEEVTTQVAGHVRSAGDYGLSGAARSIPAKVPVFDSQLTLWGNPSDPAHDAAREGCGRVNDGEAHCVVPRTNRAFLTMPTSCLAAGTPGGSMPATITADSWQEPAGARSRGVEVSGLEEAPIRISGCGELSFQPSIVAQPTTKAADSPTGLDFNLHQPQNLDATELASANLKDTTVTLPRGFDVSPAGADGLKACTEAQIGVTSRQPLHFSEEEQTCPDAAKLGTLSVSTPLLDEALPGAIYLAKPFDNPFGSLLAIYLAVEDKKTGIIAKLGGQVTPDPVSGQLTATFIENPELPLEDVSLHFFGGDRATLQTPMVCGDHTTTSSLVPWSTPEGADAHPTSTFAISSSPAGACPTQESGAPNAPNFSAGSATAKAGAYSPFVLRIARGDGTQRIGKIEATLPPGLSGKLAGIPYCSEADIAAAKAREKPNQGAAEISSPSCPLASEVGTVTVGAGAGPDPYYVKGHAYLAGPYKGAPLSMVIITPAVAGPFDLGTVVVRTALNVNLETAQITAVSDPLPTIIDGIPLDVRSVAVDLGRPDFTLNPTSCNPMQVLGSSISTLNQVAPLASRFQVGDCKSLGFKPKLKISLKGPTKRTGHPALKTVITYPKKGAYANIARVQVGLPHAEFLDQANLDKVCTQPELKSNTCPASSIYGHAKAWSPLLEKPLEGPVYLGVGYGHKLPDIVADLNGQVRILAHGRVDTTKKAGLRATFEVVPDAPVSRIVVEMKGGKKYGLLVNSENVCRKTQRASARLVAQNGKVAQLQPKIANSCKKQGSQKRRHKR